MTSNPRAFAVSAILMLVIITAALYKVKQIVVDMSTLKNSLDNASNNLANQATKIENLRSEMDDLQSER